MSSEIEPTALRLGLATHATGFPQGVGPLDVLRFNAPLPAIAVLAIVGGVIVAITPVPGLIRMVAAIGACAAAWLVVASSIATWMVFERSGLTRYAWLDDALGGPPGRWINITTGFDDTTGTLARRWRGSRMLAVDCFDASVRHEAALVRARAMRTPAGQAIRPGEPLPIPSGVIDAVLLLMAVHEIGDREPRSSVFSEAARILAPGGRLVVVEHARDLANALAFGPGVLHFAPPVVWRRAGTDAGLRLIDEQRRTPFVRVFVFESAARPGQPIRD